MEEHFFMDWEERGEVWGWFKHIAFIVHFMCNLMSSFGEGNGTPLQYSRLENPMGGGAW